MSDPTPTAAALEASATTPPTAQVVAPALPESPSWAARNWPLPRAAVPAAALLGALLTGLVVALTYVGQPPGSHVTVTVVLAAAVALVASGGGAAMRRPSAVVIGLMVLALGAVPVFRDAPWLIALCLTAAVGLGALLALDGRTWLSGVLALPALAAATGRAVPWVAGRLRQDRRARRTAPWLPGTLISLVLLVVLSALLASADAVFGRLIGSVLPEVTLVSVIGRVVLLCLVTLLVLGLAFAAASPPRWERLSIPRGRGAATEWAVPLAVTVLVLGVFVALQIVAVVDPGRGLAGTGVTPAERARQGFGQLVAVTVITSLLLAWAGRRSDAGDRRHRALLAGLGGPLILLLLGVTATALQRMWAYDSVFGATVLRLLVATFEVWLGLLVALVAVAWVTRRLAHLPRATAVSAGLVLLVLAAINPEGAVATRNIDRFVAGQQLDTRYLSGLSDDAVPAIARLSGDERACALGPREPTDAAWYAFNLARHRSQSVLDDHEPIYSRYGDWEVPEPDGSATTTGPSCP